ncbi:MAG: DUF4384 domain-containing protein [Candidatus Eisenbacteria bacterium]|uniref:DUF4384 domain-containing protein n=1 Tax=Eiseniibacteriota bacterium TaxID=2212470 RepID=A0A9D6L8K3_UNCEI|nr:DUF4384 domain-containing protein [Candidatus Eisenbacteria bacterium]MBI3538653.1 DUF4384 domain-containing protein [Candidatus Eisenbacteria bacterium]
MNRWRWFGGLVAAALVAAPSLALAGGIGVEVWNDRGNDAVYQPGERMDLRARASDDAYLLVYEIDAEGYVRVLYPYRGSSGYVEGRSTYTVPPEQAGMDLVVDRTVGQCYIVAIASADRFRDLPWYLRPYDVQAEQVGYEGMRDDESGITAEGRIVGDPFVAMERIRRRVLEDPEDGESFGTAYTSYYVHNEVRYPRYICYDCHRPGRWAWWSDFDPYYATCSVFDFRVNWRWGWGPGYWFGSVPYWFYVPRSDCPPSYRGWYDNRTSFSSWDGWRRWDAMWGGRLVRYKSPPPPGYVPPARFNTADFVRKGGVNATPPGFIPAGRGGGALRPVVGRNYQDRGELRGTDGRGPAPRIETRPRIDRPERVRGGDHPAYEPRGGADRSPRFDPRGVADRSPRFEPRGILDRAPRGQGDRGPRDQTGSRLSRGDRIPRGEPDRSPRVERSDRHDAPPRVERSDRHDPAPRGDYRMERGAGDSHRDAPPRGEGRRDGNRDRG